MSFEAHLMAFLDCNVLETWRQYKLVSNLGILNYFNCFFVKLVGVDQITYKNGK